LVKSFSVAAMTDSVKAVLVGDSAVGKTSIFQRLDDGRFDDLHVPTVGGAYVRLSVACPGGSHIAVGLWDTAGQERFRTIVPMYFQRARIVLFVFDLTSETSFENLDVWIDLVTQRAPADAKRILIGNKNDLADERQISFDTAQAKANNINAFAYIETSALTGAGFDVLQNEIGKVSYELDAPGPPNEPDSVVGDTTTPQTGTRSPVCC
jgi:small GTP-binding protein